MSDALERIKNRQRPEVPKRDPGITSTASVSVPIDTLSSSSLDIDKTEYPDIQISTLPDETALTIEVKQTTLRLEKAVSDELQALCHQQQICREVLIEAMFLEMLDAPELRERIVDRATERQSKRTAVANHKRAVSMMNKVSNY